MKLSQKILGMAIFFNSMITMLLGISILYNGILHDLPLWERLLCGIGSLFFGTFALIYLLILIKRIGQKATI